MFVKERITYCNFTKQKKPWVLNQDLARFDMKWTDVWYGSKDIRQSIEHWFAKSTPNVNASWHPLLSNSNSDSFWNALLIFLLSPGKC